MGGFCLLQRRGNLGKINEIVGKKFGRLKVISFEGLNTHRKATWLCKCECGAEKVFVGSSLKSGTVVSCGCYQSDEAKKRFSKDMTGKRFGKLTVINREGTYENKRSKLALWNCLCDCGKDVIVRGSALRNGSTQSCGCVQRENASSANTTHGLTKTPLYKVWLGMKRRCGNPNSKDYFYYGGRGICVCEDWKNDFLSFYDWARNNGYVEGLTLDRSEVNGNYEPSNCRWISQKEQSNNTRRNKFFHFDGETFTLSQIADKCGIRYSVLYKRMKRGWTLEDAVSYPVKDNGYNVNEKDN
jgi:hypothetical protein